MNKGKPNDPIEIPDRKDIHERDDELTGEDGIGPGTNAQSAQFHKGDSTEQKRFIRSQDRNSKGGLKPESDKSEPSANKQGTER